MTIIRILIEFFNKLHDCIEDLLGIEPEYIDTELENGYLDKAYTKSGKEGEDYEIVQLEDDPGKKA